MSEPDFDPDFHEAPLITLIGRPPSQLSDVELEAHINKLHSLRTSHHEVKKASGGPKPKVNSKINADVLRDLLS